MPTCSKKIKDMCANVLKIVDFMEMLVQNGDQSSWYSKCSKEISDLMSVSQW